MILNDPNILKGHPEVRLIKTPEELVEVQDMTRTEGVKPIWPSHIIRKSGACVGYLGLNTMQLARLFLDRSLKARDSANIIAVMENLYRANGNKELLTMMDPKSPFNAVAERFGYQKAGEANIYWKVL